jgi:PAS domain S-box-containing protein
VLGAVDGAVEKARLARERHANDDLARTMFESSPDCVKMLDAAGRLVTMNGPGLCLLEIEDFSTVKDSAWSDLWPERSRDLVRASVARALEGTESRFESFCPTAKGTPKWWDVIVTPVRAAGGGVDRLIAVSRDVTEYKRNEVERERLLAEVEAARARAEDANRAKDEFLAVVSHELRTPLNAMLGWLRLLRSGRLDEQTCARGFDTLERNTLAQTRLIEDLLDVSRVITGKLALVIEEVDVARLVEAAVESLGLTAKSKDIGVRTTLDPSAGIVSGDKGRLEQVVWNLLSNAIKFTPRGGTVRVLLERVHSNVEITVSDTGEGISPEFLPYVFNRFRQADTQITRAHGGLGLGLSIVRHLVELHGGTVGVRSEGEGKGATFVVGLPVAAARVGAEADGPDPTLASSRRLDSGPRLAGLRVLVVDDDPDSREILALLLGRCEADVQTASSASEALGFFDGPCGWTPDVLVSDIAMPDEDGYSLIRKVRARPTERGGTIPAVALTAYSRLEDRLQALDAGFQMHVAKPVEPAELILVLHSLIESKDRAS